MTARRLDGPELLANGEDPLPDGDQSESAQQPQRSRQDVRDAEARQQDGDREDDQPLGPLGDADVGRCPDGLGPGLGVRRHLSRHQRERRGSGDPRLAVERPVQGDAGEDGPVRQSVKRGVEDIVRKSRISTAAMNQPCGRQMSATATAATVPTTVTASGDTCIRRRPRATGSTAPLTKRRAAGLFNTG
jgi:hypothetical protein